MRDGETEEIASTMVKSLTEPMKNGTGKNRD
jgi:hypothetical protein